MTLTFVLFIVLVAFAFDFLNGFHDAANSIATVVSTRVLSPKIAVFWAAFFNFVAAFLFHEHKVAKTVGEVVDSSIVDSKVILAALVGAVVWDILTWWWGLPTSSSHALIGGFAGAAWVKAGLGALKMDKLMKIGAFIVLSPAIGMLLGLIIMVIVIWLFRNTSPFKVDREFRRLQLISAAGYSLGHGLNDAQKTMGIIAVLLAWASRDGIVGPGSFFHVGPDAAIPAWVIFGCYGAIALGTMSGGWRIVKTMGMKITKLKPFGGFCAETAGALTLVGTSMFGIPVSTTHTITGAIVGVGSVQRMSAVRWGVAGRIVWAWILTPPASALMAAATWYIVRAVS